ncbi:MAG: hypothetical protein MHPSP_001857, partial [Paramarteilia canceri]
KLKTSFCYIEAGEGPEKSISQKFCALLINGKNLFSFYSPEKDSFLEAISKTKYSAQISKVLKICEHYLMLIALKEIEIPTTRNCLPDFFQPYFDLESNNEIVQDFYEQDCLDSPQSNESTELFNLDTPKPNLKVSCLKRKVMKPSKLEKQILNFIFQNDIIKNSIKKLVVENGDSQTKININYNNLVSNFGPIKSVGGQKKLLDHLLSLYQSVKGNENFKKNSVI